MGLLHQGYHGSVTADGLPRLQTPKRHRGTPTRFKKEHSMTSTRDQTHWATVRPVHEYKKQ